MSIVLMRSPLEPIGMNGAGVRRSARLSAEGLEENEQPVKKSKPNGVQSTTVSTKGHDGDAGAAASKKKRKGKILNHSPVRLSKAQLWRYGIAIGERWTFMIWNA